MARSRQLRSIAKWVNTNAPEWLATIEKVVECTDQKIPGTRLRRVGKGRAGNRIILTDRETGALLLDHNAAETYRTNNEVEEWLSEKFTLLRSPRPKKCSRFIPGKSYGNPHFCEGCQINHSMPSEDGRWKLLNTLEVSDE